MTRRWMLQSQASLLWIWIPASHMNFNDSFVNFLDMHHLVPTVWQVINQRVLIQSPVLTPALSHSVAMGWRLSTRPAGQKTIETSSEHPVAPSMAEHLGNTCPLHKQGATCTHTHQQYHRRHTWELINIWPPLILHLQALFPGSLLSLCITSLFLRNFLWKHDITASMALSSNLQSWTFLPGKKKWNLITPDYAVQLQASTAWGMRSEYSSSCAFFKFSNNCSCVYLVGGPRIKPLLK